MLANYKLPLGAGEVEIIFTGKRLEFPDLDDFVEFAAFVRKQYQRKLKSETEAEDLKEAES